MEKGIYGFFGTYRFLSNYYYLPGGITYNDITYPTIEHAFQAQKTLDQKIRKRFSKLLKPKHAKIYGRKVKLREDWEDVKDSIMLDLIRIKFSDEVLQAKLLKLVGYQLFELNSWNDTYWGVVEGLKGKNRLGKTIMQVLHEIVLDKT